MASIQVLAAWLFYTLNRRRKVERYTLAMERYRSRLLTLGVAQWIKVCVCVCVHVNKLDVLLFSTGCVCCESPAFRSRITATG